MFSSRRNRAVAVLLSAAVIAPTTALGVSSAVAQSDESGTSKTQTDTRKRSGRGHGPDTAALATKLGVTQAKLKAAFQATRPAG